jgi:hypothetical protein
VINAAHQQKKAGKLRRKTGRSSTTTKGIPLSAEEFRAIFAKNAAST